MKTETVTAAEGKEAQETSEEQKSSNSTIENEPDVSKDVPVQKKRKRCWTCNAKLELAQRELGNCRCSKYFYLELSLDLFTGYLSCVVLSLWGEQ